MKASIITFQNWFNYGSALQGFATQEKFKEYADEVEMIDYVHPNHTFANFAKLSRQFGLLVWLRTIPSLPFYCAPFRRFVKKYIKSSAAQYLKEEDFAKFPLHDGVYVTGSDQVWNTVYNSGIAAPLYLSFVPNGMRKIAYSASFGFDTMPHDEVELSRQFIEQYERISVREESGVKILNEQYEYHNAIRLVDPTLAMPPEFWRKYTRHRKIKGEYILIYQFAQGDFFENYAKRVSDITGLPLIRICSTFLQTLKYGKSVLFPEVFEFVSLIDNAKYIITDSFHGTAFSMNLNTEPIVIYPQKYSGRLSDFLRLIDAEHRAIKDFDDFDVLNRPTDFSLVNKVLARERERVDEFLCSVFCPNGEQNL